MVLFTDLADNKKRHLQTLHRKYHNTSYVVV